MLSVLTCVVVEHDLRLVLLAALVCATACGAAFGFHLRSLRARGAPIRLAWSGLTGLVAGSGVWATHFIAMLAYQPTLPIGYAPGETALSLGMAIMGMGAGFLFPALHPGRAVTIASGALTGLAVGAMHYTGVAAMRAQAQFEWDERFVVASLLIGMAGGAAAFDARLRLKGSSRWWVPATLLLVGIVGLHFTGMTAVKLIPDPTLALPSELAGRGVLAVAAAVLVALILTAGTSLIAMERMGRRATLTGLRDALDVTPAALSFYDAHGRLISWNRAYAKLMDEIGMPPAEGILRSDFIDAAMRSGWRPIDGSDHLTRRRDVVEGESSAAKDLVTPDGRWIRHEAFSTPDGGGVTVLTDTTEQHETTRALAAARDSAEAANRAKSQFLANMSHEIRTPLNGVLGVADVLASTPLSREQQELVGVIQTSGSLLNALLTDLLDLARVEAGAVELRPGPASLVEIAESVRSLYASRADQKGVTLRLEEGLGAGGRVICDALRLRQVLGNLVSNAVKFTDSGEVIIRLGRDGNLVTFAVSDTGSGFDEALKGTLFGRFQQADDSSTRRHGGAGLGLAICKEFVGLMGGTLDCESEPGVGSTFRFALDLPWLDDAPMGLMTELGVGATAATEPGRFRVLVVDDNAINRQVLGLILDSAGIEHATAEDGRQGLDAAMTGDFDAVLMDIQMPIMDGFEATRRIRSWEAVSGRRRMPIFTVSANCLQEHVDAGLAAGADGHVSKPVSVPDLLALLGPHAAAAREAA